MPRAVVALHAANPKTPKLLVVNGTSHVRPGNEYLGVRRCAGTMADMRTYMRRANAVVRQRDAEAFDYEPVLALDTWPQTMLTFAAERAADEHAQRPNLAHVANWPSILNTVREAAAAAHATWDAAVADERVCSEELVERYETLRPLGIQGAHAAAEFAHCQQKLTEAMRAREAALRTAYTAARESQLRTVRETVDYMNVLSRSHATRLSELALSHQERMLASSAPPQTQQQQPQEWWQRLWLLASTTITRRLVPVLQADTAQLRRALAGNNLETVVHLLSKFMESVRQPLPHIDMSVTLNDSQLLATQEPLITTLYNAAMQAADHTRALVLLTEGCMRLLRMSEQIASNGELRANIVKTENQRLHDAAGERLKLQVQQTLASARAQLDTSVVDANKSLVDDWTQTWTQLRRSHVVVASHILSDMSEWFSAAQRLHEASIAKDLCDHRVTYATEIAAREL